MGTETITIGWLLNKAWMLLVGLWWYEKRNRDAANKERDDKLDKLMLTIHDHESRLNKGPSEKDIRAMIKEHIDPIKDDQQEIKTLLQGLNDSVQHLSKDMAVQNAIRNMKDGTTQQSDAGR